eukprot:FR739211.1.p2 GENE.FR739211.1~~FR739211.1.p2  ORF type:complete len:135 (+),score=9.53 FR739211.1:410-814(+)
MILCIMGTLPVDMGLHRRLTLPSLVNLGTPAPTRGLASEVPHTSTTLLAGNCSTETSTSRRWILHPCSQWKIDLWAGRGWLRNGARHPTPMPITRDLHGDIARFLDEISTRSRRFDLVGRRIDDQYKKKKKTKK